MLTPTVLGRFGESFVSLVTPDVSGAFERIKAHLDSAEDVSDLGGDAGSRFGKAQVGVVVSGLTHEADDQTEHDEEQPPVDLLFIGIFISDSDDDDELSVFPPTGPAGGVVNEVDFADLISATANELPGRHPFVYRSHLTANVDDAQTEFPLPISFWRSRPPFGSLIGARFELDVRGARDGWLALDSRDDEIAATIGFVRNTELSTGTIDRAWAHLRRIYDKVLIPIAHTGDSTL